MTRKTMGVLAGCYLRGIRGGQAARTHTHRAEVDGSWPVPLCKRVRRGSLTDDTTQHTDERPTCPACARIFDRETE